MLFGPNAAGKSNLLDAIQALSRIGTSRTLSDALSEPIRGYPIEAFTFPAGGLPELLSNEAARFNLEADVQLGKERYRYRVAVELQPRSGSLAVRDEYLTGLNAKGEPKGSAAIETEEATILLRRKSHPGRPRKEPAGQNFTMLSDPRLGAPEYRQLERVRRELDGWWTYYLDPRVAMRSARPPAEAYDIGVLGESIAPFLYRLRAENPKHFDAIKRTLRTLIPGVEDLAEPDVAEARAAKPPGDLELVEELLLEPSLVQLRPCGRDGQAIGRVRVAQDVEKPLLRPARPILQAHVEHIARLHRHLAEGATTGSDGDGQPVGEARLADLGFAGHQPGAHGQDAGDEVDDRLELLAEEVTGAHDAADAARMRVTDQ